MTSTLTIKSNFIKIKKIPTPNSATYRYYLHTDILECANENKILEALLQSVNGKRETG